MQKQSVEGCGGERECRRWTGERWEWKRQAGYWKSQHGRAKARGERWRAERAQHRVTQQKLVQAQAECEALQRQAVAGKQAREALQQQVAEWQQAVAGQPPNRADLLRAAFGTRSEKQAPEPDAGEAGPGPGRSGRRTRGGQAGARAHPRVARPELEERTEEREMPAERRVCGDCGRPFQRHGVAVSERVEVEVRSYRRRIRRHRYRAACECAQARGRPTPTVQAALPPTLFRGTSYGLSVWVEFLLQVYWQRRPVRAFEREWAERGLALPASSLLGHQQDFVDWFAPLEQAIGVHQQQALLVHGDETSWRVQAWGEQGHNPRGWLWACLTSDAVRFRVDPARSALSAFFAYIEREQQSVVASAPAAGDPRLGPLTSLLRYRTGLSVCERQPGVPMDNNRVERALRRSVIGRQLSHGSHSPTGAELQGLVLSVCSMLDMAGIDLGRWLEAFLEECARLGPGATVPQPQAWLPWDMHPARQVLFRPG